MTVSRDVAMERFNMFRLVSPVTNPFDVGPIKKFQPLAYKVEMLGGGGAK